MTVACPDDESWTALARVVDPHLLDDPRFVTAELRRANEAELDLLIAAWTSRHDRWEATRRLQAAGVAAFPSLSPAELWCKDPQLAAIGTLERPEHPRTGTCVLPGIPWRLARSPNGLRRPAPLPGEHTAEVLGELGFDRDEIGVLAERGAVSGPVSG